MNDISKQKIALQDVVIKSDALEGGVSRLHLQYSPQYCVPNRNESNGTNGNNPPQYLSNPGPVMIEPYIFLIMKPN